MLYLLVPAGVDCDSSADMAHRGRLELLSGNGGEWGRQTYRAESDFSPAETKKSVV